MREAEIGIDNEQIFKIQMPEENVTEVDVIEDKIANNLSDNIKRSFLNSRDPILNLARVKYIEPDNFIFDKINLNTLCIMFGNEDALKVSCLSRKVLTLINDKTLVELCHDTKDYACQGVILEHLVKDTSVFINQDMIQILFGNKQTDESRMLLSDHQMITSRYETGISK